MDTTTQNITHVGCTAHAEFMAQIAERDALWTAREEADHAAAESSEYTDGPGPLYHAADMASARWQAACWRVEMMRRAQTEEDGRRMFEAGY